MSYEKVYDLESGIYLGVLFSMAGRWFAENRRGHTIAFPSETWARDWLHRQVRTGMAA